MQYSQEHLKTMVYAEFGGQTECIMGNWKIENTAISRKVVGKKVHATILKGNMGYDQYIVPDTVAVDLLLLLSFSSRTHTSMASSVILSNFFEEK